ncbi:BTB/POZ and MATH domain-containing protein 2 [Rhynchospora pubera]|uniref:BTB/POZ and MATH domain-containing protein 2 n=1 Tax=Rhynchospora pubera TaxID=906938 RepID=A0AAV8D972_9POAL|nr:BTB/POZ and MATH domain-containing protein 2 [Rhynchospora pubera]
MSDPSKMVSVCKTETFSTVHRVNIVGYSLANDFGDTSIEAGKFNLAGHTWALCYRPNVVIYDNYRIKTEFITFSLVLVTQPKVPMAVSFELSLLNQDGKSSPDATKSLKRIFKEKGSDGFSNFMETSKLLASEYLKNDSLLVQCSLQVKKPSCTEKTMKIVVPPPEMNQHFGWLFGSKEGADVTFHLNEETCVAHKAILAACSPVFIAQFFGSMMESKTDSVEIEDIKPEIFKAMLYFIYTEKLPPGEDVSLEMAQHLLVAADRYGLERLKMICAEMLCTGIDAKTAAATLAFAVQYSCLPLKDFCVDFVASREMLDEVMVSDGFEHLVSSCPSVLKEILEKVKKVF